MQTQSTENFWQSDANYWFEQPNSSKKGLSQNSVEKILFSSKKIKKKILFFKFRIGTLDMINHKCSKYKFRWCSYKYIRSLDSVIKKSCSIKNSFSL